MSGPFRAVLIFNETVDGGRVAGWETHLWSQQSNISKVIADLKDLIPYWNAILGGALYVSAARVSDATTYRNAQTVGFPPGIVSKIPPAYATVAVHCTCWGTTLQATPLWIRGIYNNVFNGPIFDATAFQNLQGYPGWYKRLTNGAGAAWAIRRIPPQEQRVQIVAWNGLLTVTPTLTLLASLDLNVGDQIRVQLVKGAPILKRVWTVTSVSPDGLTVGIGPLAAPLFTANPPITANGKVRDVSPDLYAYEAITKVTTDYMSSHKTGRPPLVLTGKPRIPR